MSLFLCDVDTNRLTIELDSSVEPDSSASHPPISSLTNAHTEPLYQTLAQAIWLSGHISPPALCSGLGRCGACRVRFHEKAPDATDIEHSILGESALSDGWRLACRHAPKDGMRIELPIRFHPPHPQDPQLSLSSQALRSETISRHSRNHQRGTEQPFVYLAIDLGTTSIHWRALRHLPSGDWETIDSGQRLNPQLGAGSDVVSRIALAVKPQGRAQLRAVLLPFLQSLVARLPFPVAELCIAGNTAMTAILLDADCTGLAVAPCYVPETGGYSVTFTDTDSSVMFPDTDSRATPIQVDPERFHPFQRANDILVSLRTAKRVRSNRFAALRGFGGNDSPRAGSGAASPKNQLHRILPPVWIPPQLAPFVGGDISAGMTTFLWARDTVFPFLLADLGTNGEMVLCPDPHTAYITSVPLGPSLEGIGLSCGGIAKTGSIDAFCVTPKGLKPSVIGGGEAENLCATGYLSLIATLLKSGVLDAFGHPVASSPHPLAQKILSTMTVSPEGWRLPVTASIWLSAVDVEEILKVKAAFSLAFESLLNASHLTSRELAEVILGGSLGEHAPLEALEIAGFLPHGLASRTRAAGNTSLDGAALLLQHPEYRPLLTDWSRTCQLVALTDTPDFTSRYMHHMRFSF